MVSKFAIENNKYKLLGFENRKELAILMIMSTGKIIKVDLGTLIRSDIIDNLNKAEIKNIYKNTIHAGPH